ncbi:F510_1955 family glycosylhydrolase [Anaerobacillus sp. MEB173]|uniref:F510_1955 family glycosylhydrolase n=1 Tax=Anaerobacillus sp. MEB173 TaxID=3383345 RepID=UPI003F93B331
MKKSLLIATTFSFTILLSACGSGNSAVPEDETNIEQVTMDNQVTQQEDGMQNDDHTEGISNHDFFEPYDGLVDHIHGLGYAGNQNAIFIAAHDGIRVYENGKWFKTKELNNDYMGFNAVNQGFYASGHPGPGVNLPNPLGLKRSFDNGQTLEDLGMEGESDFHAMGVGFNNHTVYLLNEMPSSTLGLGLYVSKDKGQSWSEINADELGENILNIAVHPTNGDMVAIASQRGVFLSKDAGQNFILLTTKQQGTSVHFSEETLWYGAYGKEPVLVKYSLENETKEQMELPTMNQDAVMYLAQNPQKKSEIVFATFNGHIYKSDDAANTWNLLVKEGKIQ